MKILAKIFRHQTSASCIAWKTQQNSFHFEWKKIFSRDYITNFSYFLTFIFLSIGFSPFFLFSTFNCTESSTETDGNSEDSSILCTLNNLMFNAISIARCATHQVFAIKSILSKPHACNTLCHCCKCSHQFDK